MAEKLSAPARVCIHRRAVGPNQEASERRPFTECYYSWRARRGASRGPLGTILAHGRPRCGRRMGRAVIYGDQRDGHLRLPMRLLYRRPIGRWSERRWPSLGASHRIIDEILAAGCGGRHAPSARDP
ncbi:hypothetical protein MRX96_034458 [Rhipicephalus microplus]